MKTRRLVALLLCVLMSITIFPASAFALSEVTINSESNAAFDYLEYYSDSSWHDLNTPRHWVAGTNELAYCVQHKNTNPVGANYRELDVSDLYSSRTLRGLRIILEYGYPNSNNGLTNDQARQATANAIRFWLTEEGDPAHYGFTNRAEHPTYIRAKSGYGAVLTWADQLLALARAQVPMPHSVNFSPSNLALTVSGDYFVGTSRVTLTNCNGGYQLNQSTLPPGTVIEGFTGNSGDMLTIKVSKQYGNQNITLRATGYDNRINANLTWYGPKSGNYQNVMVADTLPGVGGEGVLHMSTPAFGKIQIVKTDAENSNRLAGAVFGIYGNSACTNEVTRLTTDSNGTAITGDLIMGTYYVKEITAPSGYVVNGTVFTANVTTSTYTVTVPDTPAKGRIEVSKTNSDPAMGDYSLQGAVFDVCSGDTVVASVTTGANGKGTSVSIPLGTYTVRERTAPTGFVRSAQTATVTLSYAGQTVPIVYGEATIPNKPQVGTITVTKVDAETGSHAQGDATLHGAKYQIRNSAGTVVDTLHALGTRVVTSKELPLGTYTVTEIEAPEGYLLNPASKSVTLSYGGQNVELVTQSTTIQDAVKKGRISIVKFGNVDLSIPTELDPDIKPPLENVQFEIRLKSSGVLYDTLITDADGKAESHNLPYGIYIVTETVGVEGYLKVQPFEVFVSENGKTYSYIIEDKAIEMMIKLVKQDADTNKTIPVAGATFRIEDSSGHPVSFEILYPQPHTLSEFVTDESGTLYLPAKLPYGTYTLIEVQAPTGYLLNGDPATFNVNETDAENGVITVRMKDTAVKGTISVEKSGEMLTGFTTAETDYGVKHISVYETRGLAGVVFEVFAAENIGTPDGTVYHRAGEKVAELTTDANGMATTAALYLGKYNVVEKSVPEGYVLDATPHEVTLVYEDQHTALVTEIIGIGNARQQARVDIAKIAEYFDYTGGVFYTDYGKGFVFGLYAKNAIGDIPADALMDVLVTDDTGRASSAADLPLAEYYLRELDVPHGYIDAGRTWEIDLTSKNNIDLVFTDDTHAQEPLTNEMHKSRIAVIKKDANDTERRLEGATFAVLNPEDKTIITTFTTNENGYGVSCDLPVGKYLLQEIAAPTGFKLTDKTYAVELTNDSPAIVRYGMTNEANEVILKKMDITDFAALPGALIQVFDANGELFFEGETDSDGQIVIRELSAGTYTWRETAAPEGYALNMAEFTFSIDEYGKVTGDTEMTDEPITVIVEKKDSYDGQPMGGVVFHLLDADGNAVRLKAVDGGYLIPAEDGKEAFTVGSDGKNIIKYLRVGNYALVEETPSGYVSADSYPLTITDEHSASDPYSALILNAPTALKVFKVHEKTNIPVSGAGFSFKVRGVLFLKTLKFIRLENGYYKVSEQGDTDRVMVDASGEAFIIGLPLGEVWMEESVVPEGFFPAAPVKLIITKDHCMEEPLIATVPNAPFVKLGMDTDKYNVLIAIGLCLAGVGVVVWRVIRRKKKQKNTEVK